MWQELGEWKGLVRNAKGRQLNQEILAEDVTQKEGDRETTFKERSLQDLCSSKSDLWKTSQTGCGTQAVVTTSHRSSP